MVCVEMRFASSSSAMVESSAWLKKTAFKIKIERCRGRNRDCITSSWPNQMASDWMRTCGKRMVAVSLGVGMLLGSAPDLSSALAAQNVGCLDASECSTKKALGPSNPYNITFPSSPDFDLPKYEQFVLDNGMKVFILEDKEIPIVRGRIFMKGGQLMEPEDKVGLSLIAAAAQRGGGSISHPWREIDDRLDEISATITSGATPLTTTMGFECLKEDTPEVLNLVSDIIREPAIPQEKVSLYRGQLLEAIKHRNDNNADVARRVLEEVIYGSSSLYARKPMADSVSKITRADVIRYLEECQRPDASILGLVGDFSSPEMKQLVQQSFGAWRIAPGQPVEPYGIPKSEIPEQVHAGWVFLVQDDGAKQISVAMGELGISSTDEAYPPLDVLSGIFNSYGGRLFDEIRSKEGLAYSVSGQWVSPTDHPGVFILESSTTMPLEFLEKARAELQLVTREAPSEMELEKEKASSINSFVFNFASTAAQLNRAMVYDILGLPNDYLFQYKSKVEKVTPSDVLWAAGKHLHPENETIVMVGDVNRLKPALTKLGYIVIPYQPN